jgi:hypothetical protein
MTAVNTTQYCIFTFILELSDTKLATGVNCSFILNRKTKLKHLELRVTAMVHYLLLQTNIRLTN